MSGDTRLVLGWREWAGLPELGVPAIRAKIDTGARTSALHATQIEPFGPARVRRVRFLLHPNPRQSDVQALCEAELADQRVITSSNGLGVLRCIIRTSLTVRGVTHPVELSLIDRAAMRHALLIGREALKAFSALVDPSTP